MEKHNYRNLIKLAMCLLIIVSSVCALVVCAAEEAEDITQVCHYSGCNPHQLRRMIDGRVDERCLVDRGESVMISHPNGIGGLVIAFFENPPATELQVKNEDGVWQTVGTCGNYLLSWYALPDHTTEVRIVAKKKSSKLQIANIWVYGQGNVPASAPCWEEMEKADIMLVVAHPDDELLWFGGLLPTYGCERALRVQVVYATSWYYRKLELLQGLWTCGIHYYPTMLDFIDLKAPSKKAMLNRWGNDRFYNAIVSAIRQYQPEVIVTHDMEGEYGHMAHKTTAYVLSQIVPLISRNDQYPESAEQYGTWTVKKLYVHLWPENQIHMDWTKPLSAFDGETSISVATRALDCHVSQVKSDRAWSMDRAADYDNGLFGLYWTTVGPDEAGDDIMEHIELN